MARSKPTVPVAVAETLDQNRRLAALLAQARLHDRLLECVRRVLPAPVAAHCLACVVRADQRLVLYADSAAWASQLRFYEARLLRALNGMAPVSRILVRILLQPEGMGKPPPALRAPAARVLEQLQQSAAAMPDPETRQALQHLVRTLRRRRDSAGHEPTV